MHPDPDEWWHSLPIARRRQIYRWIEQPGNDNHPPTPGQRPLFPIDTEDPHEADLPHTDCDRGRRRDGDRAGRARRRDSGRAHHR